MMRYHPKVAANGERNRRGNRWRCKKKGRGGTKRGRQERRERRGTLPARYSALHLQLCIEIMKRSRWANRFCHSLQDARTHTHMHMHAHTHIYTY